MRPKQRKSRGVCMTLGSVQPLSVLILIWLVLTLFNYAVSTAEVKLELTCRVLLSGAITQFGRPG